MVESYRDEDGQIRQRTITGLGKCPTVEARLAELHAELECARARGGVIGEMAALIPTLEIARLEPIARRLAGRPATARALKGEP